MTEHVQNPGVIEIPLSTGAVLKQVQPSEAALLLVAMRSNKRRLNKYGIHVPSKKQPEVVEKRIARFMGGRGLDLGIWNDGQLTGEIGVSPFDTDPRVGAIWYWIDKKHEGQGHITSALRELIKYAFEQNGYLQLQASVNMDNRRSRNTLERAGFQIINSNLGIKQVSYGLLAGDTPVSPVSSEATPN